MLQTKDEGLVLDLLSDLTQSYPSVGLKAEQKGQMKAPWCVQPQENWVIHSEEHSFHLAQTPMTHDRSNQKPCSTIFPVPEGDITKFSMLLELLCWHPVWNLKGLFIWPILHIIVCDRQVASSNLEHWIKPSQTHTLLMLGYSVYILPQSPAFICTLHQAINSGP